MKEKRKGVGEVFKVCNTVIRMSLFQQQIMRAIVCVT